jgi:hypothetical protein
LHGAAKQAGSRAQEKSDADSVASARAGKRKSS